MNYSIIKQWKTLSGEYHSATVDKADYNTAIGTFHSMFLPMQNDANVSSFRFTMIDEHGVVVEKCGWTRPVAEMENSELSE